eukprot:5218040-Pyramimonas_sp.AAC.1
MTAESTMRSSKLMPSLSASENTQTQNAIQSSNPIALNFLPPAFFRRRLSERKSVHLFWITSWGMN